MKKTIFEPQENVNITSTSIVELVQKTLDKYLEYKLPDQIEENNKKSNYLEAKIKGICIDIMSRFNLVLVDNDNNMKMTMKMNIMNDCLNLYVFRPTGYGGTTYFLMAHSKEEAKDKLSTCIVLHSNDDTYVKERLDNNMVDYILNSCTPSGSKAYNIEVYAADQITTEHLS